jgi:hypothetical protein
MNRRIAATLAPLILFASLTHAQNYAIPWHKIAGGGGVSLGKGGGTAYAVSGTVGQPDASGAMTGGSYSLTGGFWALYAVQTAGAPTLTIAYSGKQAVVSWPASATGWTLQTNNSLATGAWGNYSGVILNNSVTNSPTGGTLFFRLANP